MAKTSTMLHNERCSVSIHLDAVVVGDSEFSLCVCGRACGRFLLCRLALCLERRLEDTGHQLHRGGVCTLERILSIDDGHLDVLALLELHRLDDAYDQLEAGDEGQAVSAAGFFPPVHCAEFRGDRSCLERRFECLKPGIDPGQVQCRREAFRVAHVVWFWFVECASFDSIPVHFVWQVSTLIF